MAKKEFLLTSEGFLDLETELNELKNVRRPKVIEAIKALEAKVIYLKMLTTTQQEQNKPKLKDVLKN